VVELGDLLTALRGSNPVIGCLYGSCAATKSKRSKSNWAPSGRGESLG
jgi:hypothetical protein